MAWCSRAWLREAARPSAAWPRVGGVHRGGARGPPLWGVRSERFTGRRGGSWCRGAVPGTGCPALAKAPRRPCRAADHRCSPGCRGRAVSRRARSRLATAQSTQAGPSRRVVSRARVVGPVASVLAGGARARAAAPSAHRHWRLGAAGGGAAITLWQLASSCAPGGPRRGSAASGWCREQTSGSGSSREVSACEPRTGRGGVGHGR